MTTATPDTHLLQLGIYDDGDRTVTFHMMMFTGPLTLAMLEELLDVAEEAYQRRPPAHACFWDCSPAPEDDSEG